MSVRLWGDRIARISVIAYCRDAAWLDGLVKLVRQSAHLRLEAATQSVGQLEQIAVRSSRAVVVARLQAINDELAEVLSHCEGLPLVLLAPEAHKVALRALRAGASAIIGTDASAEKIAAAVIGANHGLVAAPGDAFADPQDTLALPPEPLTARELEILSLLAGGDSNKTIAAQLSISVHTVKFHISSILSKLGVTSRTEAVALGLRLGIVLL